jgi:hypothetical protein
VLHGHHPPRCSRCEEKPFGMNWTILLLRSHQLIVSLFPWEILSLSLPRQNWSTAQRRYTPRDTPTSASSSISASTSAGTELQTFSIEGNSGNTVQANSGSSSISPMPKRDRLWVIFGVKDMHEFNDIENIATSSELNDQQFFTDLKIRFNKYRWFFQRWGSPFRFRHCKFVQVSQSILFAHST